jgi:DNA-binding CsgD family transcriptional regulator
VIYLVRARKRSDSERLKRQLKVLIAGVLSTFVLYFLAWYLEIAFGLPNMMVLAGGVLVAVNFYLVARYRYLRRDAPLLEKHLADIVQDSAFLLDGKRHILGVNLAAAALTSQSEAELAGRNFGDLLDDPKALEREWNLAVGRRATHRGLPCSMAGKSVFLTLVPRFDRFGDFVGTVVLVGDLERFDQRTAEAGITPREKQILLLTLQGRNFQEIGDALSISPATVKTHMHHICEKTGSANRVDLFGRLLSSETG